MSELSPTLNPVFVAYVLLFGIAALACFASLPRARGITNDGTRRGLVALLVTSGGWSVAHLGFLLAPSVELKLVFYHAGLLVGLSTVGPWLYFCSAYTGRNLHKSASIRRAAIAVFLIISLVKVTNPLHQRYFQPEVLVTPFPHLSILSQELHWLAMGLAYALAVIGYFMLFELFRQVGHDTTPLLGLIGLTGLPIVLDALAVVSPTIINITYEPLGVAAFAVGVLFVFIDDFQTVQLTGQQDDPVLVLDDEYRVRDFNTKSKELFPELEVNEDIETVVPEIAEYIDGEENTIFELETAGGFKYYHLGIRPFTTNRSRLGTSVAFTDVTEREEYRRELERQNERLEQFASMVSHDLRNPLNVAQGRVDYLQGEDDNEHLAATARALDRMEGLIEDVLALARQGQPIAEREHVTLSAVAEDAWAVVESDTATLTIDSDGTFIADATRLQQLLENLFRNAIEHGGTDVEISVGTINDGSGFFIADNGAGIPVQDRKKVLESGYSTASEGTGLGLSIVSEIVAAHDWQIDVTSSETGGARFEIAGVQNER
ncbi:ATP-binding protein [Haloarcula amylolytica]|uniref:sensor histidine kinase n=1 Tax=Haloarcula amylolytica TaxID=396317 RepID=UPI003C7317A0